ncbi:MAG: pyridoxamine 5'-phosphate oxidase family protein [Cellulophaga sp.]
MTASSFQEFKTELQKATVEKGHPFKCFTFATVGLERMARLRTVVLRTISEELDLTFYTDKRSKKILHIKENNKVSLLFYHPEKQLQLKIDGIATIVSKSEECEKIWKNMPSVLKRDYTTATSPGSTTSNPNDLEYLNAENHFSMVTVNPFKIEYLKIQQPNPVKIRFSKKENSTNYGEVTGWESAFLVP